MKLKPTRPRFPNVGSRMADSMRAPTCPEHDSPMILVCTRIVFQNHRVVDIYGCEVPGCLVKYAQKLGGFGVLDDQGRFVQNTPLVREVNPS